MSLGGDIIHLDQDNGEGGVGYAPGLKGKRISKARGHALELCLSNRRLLEKSQRVEAIIASMQATGAEEAQLQEIEEMITAPERQQLETLKRNVNK